MQVHVLEAGLQWLDGGAMFGVVPRPLWERKIAPDHRHRIPLALRCLLVEAPNALVLVRGTIFSVDAGHERTTVCVESGVVEVRGARDVALVESGAQVTVSAAGIERSDCAADTTRVMVETFASPSPSPSPPPSP